MVSCGASSTKLELLDFFGLLPDSPSASAFNQQRAKLKPDALEAVFHQFNSSVLSMEETPHYHFLAADGSTFTYFEADINLLVCHACKTLQKNKS